MPFPVTADGLAVTHRVPGYERAFAVRGLGGNGITFAVTRTQIIATMIAGRPGPEAAILRYR